MNFYEAQEFIKTAYPNTLVVFEFDNLCIKMIEIMHTQGQANSTNHIEYDKVKVVIDAAEAIYVPILSHRMCIDFENVKSHVNALQIWIPESSNDT